MKKRTCVEFDEKMTGLVQQIKDLYAVRDGLFCNCEIMKGGEFSKKLDDVNFQLLCLHSALFTLISIDIEFRNECEHQEAENDN